MSLTPARPSSWSIVSYRGVRLKGRTPLAPPSTICLSETAHHFTSRSANVPFEDLGLQLVKNLDAPVRAYLARPAFRARAEGIPSVRWVEAHLARRFYDVCRAPLLAITAAENLSPREYAVLRALEDAPGLDAPQLADRLAVSPDEAATLLGRLQALGFAEPTASGPREPTLAFTLTSRGKDVRRKLRPHILAAQDAVVASLSEQERAALRDLLVRVIQANETKARRDAGQLR
jgi:adenylate cyclase